MQDDIGIEYVCGMKYGLYTATFGILLVLLSIAALQPLQAQSFAGPKGVQVVTVLEGNVQAIWTKLLDFEAYPAWNPYIKLIEGSAAKGRRLHIIVKGKEKDYDFKAKVLDCQPNKSFAWGGSALFFFKARHYFMLEDIGNGQLKFTQGEQWGGLFGKSYGKGVYEEAQENFQKMNVAIGQ
jgi:hypothetical protein